MTKTIAFFDTKPYDIESFDEANRSFGFDIRYITARLAAQSLPMAAGADAVCAFVNDRLDAEVIEQLVKLGVKIVALRSAGYNNVDLRRAYGQLHVVRVPAYSPHAVAEHAVALLLTLNRKTHKAYFRTRDNNFSIVGFVGFDLFEKTAGIIGTGKIGLVLARILKGFGMNVLAHDKFPNAEAARGIGFDYVELDELLARSDVVSLNCPLTPESYHLIDASALAKMKSGVVLINTGRGKLIDTRALIQALKERKIGAAGLDVYEEESEYFFEDFSGEVIDDDVLARLLTFSNVLITSHQGFFTKEALANIAQTTLANIRDYFTDGSLANEICYKCSMDGARECRRLREGRCFVP